MRNKPYYIHDEGHARRNVRESDAPTMLAYVLMFSAGVIVVAIWIVTVLTVGQ